MTGATFNDQDKLKVKEVLLTFFNYASDITADLSFSAEYRHVKSRHRTTTESDDDIELWYGSYIDTTKITLIHKDQLKPSLWKLHDKTDAARIPMQLHNPSLNASGELLFYSNKDARDFLLWLQQKTAHLISKSGVIGSSGYKLLKADGSPIDAATIQKLMVGVS